MIKRIIPIMVVFLLIGSHAFSAPYRSVVNAVDTSNTTDIEVASTGTVYTKSIDGKDIQNDGDVGIMYKATSDGVVDLSLSLQESFKPLKSGAVDTDYVTTSVINSSVTDEVWHLATVDTVILPYLRFIATGQGSNDASTTIEIKVSK
jgi:hypothetical protein